VQKSETRLLRLSRLLTPEHQADLLALVRLAYAAETSARKSLGFAPVVDGALTRKPQEYSCEDILHL
jgi:hypothetical protein